MRKYEQFYITSQYLFDICIGTYLILTIANAVLGR